MAVFGIPIGNGLILLGYGVELVSISIKFKSRYASHPFLTIATTNLVLMGLSDTLAQTLRCLGHTYQSNEEHNPFVRFILDKGRVKQVWLDEAGDDLHSLGLAEPPLDARMYREHLSHNENGDYTPLDYTQPSSKIVNRYIEFDFRRWSLFSFWALATCTLQWGWYAFLRSAYSEDAKLITIVQRVLADQLLYSPIMLTCFLLYLGVVVEGKTADIINESFFWRKYVKTLSLNLCIWPLAQFINFLLIPNALQIPFSSCISVLWNTYLSLNTE